MYKFLLVVAYFPDDNETTACTTLIVKCLESLITILIAVVGCADMIPPEGAWAQRDGDVTTVGCHDGNHTWTLRCEDSVWKGDVGSCDTGRM